jgi:hypothetical protein
VLIDRTDIKRRDHRGALAVCTAWLVRNTSDTPVTEMCTLRTWKLISHKVRTSVEAHSACRDWCTGAFRETRRQCEWLCSHTADGSRVASSRNVAASPLSLKPQALRLTYLETLRRTVTSMYGTNIHSL